MVRVTYFVVVALIGCSHLSCSKAQDTSTDRHVTAASISLPPAKGWEFTATAIERAKSFNITPQMVYEAHRGYELAVVLVSVRPAPGNPERQVTVKTIEMHDLNDVRSACAISSFVHDLDKHGEAKTIVCEVPVATRLRTLTIGTQSVDLTQLQK